MRCPHCQADIEVKAHFFALGQDPDGSWQVSTARCPICDRIVVNLCNDKGHNYPAWPPSTTRPPLSDDIPAPWRTEYRTACQVLPYSAEASAALSRRMLSRFLTECLDLQGEHLGPLLEQACLLPGLPAYLKEGLKLFADLAELQPQAEKSVHPGSLLPVRAEEAEWALDLLESLLDFHFAAPARLHRKQKALMGDLAQESGRKDDNAPAID